MFKVISTETKKMLSKPGIYILSILLAIILILGVFIYNPQPSRTASITLNGSNFTEKYEDFMGDALTANTYGYKNQADTIITNATNSLKNYRVESNGQLISTEEHINKQLKNFEAFYKTYVDYTYITDATEHNISVTQSKLIDALDKLYDAVTAASNKTASGSFVLLTSAKNLDQFNQSYKDVRAHFNVKRNKPDIADHCAEYSQKLKPAFYEALNSFTYPVITDSIINLYTVDDEISKFAILNGRLEEIMSTINEKHTLAINNADQNKALKDEMDVLANAYMATVSTYANLIKYELINNAFNSLSTQQQLDTKYLSDYSRLDSSSLLIRYDYLFQNNKTENDYAIPLTIGRISNVETNAYDYAYFVLKLFSFVIIIYAMMSACHAIAGEIKEGSMRYLAIRPVSRFKLYLGKLLSIISLSTILLLFSAIIAILVGGTVYGFSSLNILTIFNGNTALVIHPLVMILILFLSIMLEIIIYTSIAMLFSTLFKSDLLGITILIAIYLINVLLPLFVTSPNSWLTYYPFSHINFFALFGSSVYSVEGVFSALLGAKVYTTTNLVLTSSIILLIILIVNILALKFFKKKEF